MISQRIIYQTDSIGEITCYDEQGAMELGKNDCIEKKLGTFLGGLTGWRTFLERNMRYPDDAQRDKLSGIVHLKFTIDVDGNVKNPEIISSPGVSLSKEALRIMLISPKWIPAEMHNRKVEFVQTQRITFALM